MSRDETPHDQEIAGFDDPEAVDPDLDDLTDLEDDDGHADDEDD